MNKTKKMKSQTGVKNFKPEKIQAPTVIKNVQ